MRSPIECGDAQMIGLYFLRLYRQSLAAGGALALAWWIVGAPPYGATAALTNSASQFTVNQFRKGDRLPMIRTPAVSRDLLTPPSLQSGKKLPLGCDPVVFGPIASPAANSVYGRCIV
jgi:hypothetical protein